MDLQVLDRIASDESKKAPLIRPYWGTVTEVIENGRKCKVHIDGDGSAVDVYYQAINSVNAGNRVLLFYAGEQVVVIGASGTSSQNFVTEEQLMEHNNNPLAHGANVLKVTLKNGWVNGAAIPAVSVIGGVAFMSGAIHSGPTTVGTVVGTIEGYKSSMLNNIVTFTLMDGTNIKPIEISIEKSGDIRLNTDAYKFIKLFIHWII